MRIARLNTTDLHIRVDGPAGGPAVVFANSLGTDLRLWDPILPHLPESLQLVRFDKRGHGLSACPAAPYAMDDLVDDAEALLEHLGLRDVVFVGLSIGGMIAQGLAARRPDMVRAMVLSNTAVKMGEAEMWNTRIAAIRENGIASLSDAILERWFGTTFRTTPELELWRAMLERTPVEGYLGCCHAIAGTDLSASTATLTLPTQVIAGVEDGASPPELVKATADLIAGSRFAEIPGTGHLPCVEAPEAYARILTEFLKEVDHV